MTSLNWKISHAYGSEELLLLKCLYCPKQRPNSKVFTEIEQIIQLYELQKTLNIKAMEKNKVGNITLSDLKTIKKLVVTQNMWWLT